jgi:hypothetical protein
MIKIYLKILKTKKKQFELNFHEQNLLLVLLFLYQIHNN